METLKFKTNIKCGGCIAAVTSALDQLKGVEKWEVDTDSPDKILSVQADDGFNPSDVIAALSKTEYRAELL